jgi:CheY-like chemotaxis protein
MRKVNTAEPINSNLTEIRAAAQRSADLTKQLLAFARRQTVAPIVLDLNDCVATMLKILKRLIGEDIDLVCIPRSDLWPIKIDPAQIDQLLTNLCVNARDAIAGVGKVTIETENIAFDKAYCDIHTGFVCGEYVMLAVSDDGSGMSKEVIDNLFEPFFTTKAIGKGTGLGLATVYGIVKQNEGFIKVYSEPGEGTTFKVHLPRFAGQAIEPQDENNAEIPKGQGETILLVDDELAILNVGRAMPEELCYKVLTAGTPGEALRQFKAHGPEIQLLITDVVMPEMNGRDLAKLILGITPGLKCLFTSGYTANVIALYSVLDEGVNFLQKPFSINDFASKVREVLEQK